MVALVPRKWASLAHSRGGSPRSIPARDCFVSVWEKAEMDACRARFNLTACRAVQRFALATAASGSIGIPEHLATDLAGSNLWWQPARPLACLTSTLEGTGVVDAVAVIYLRLA